MRGGEESSHPVEGGAHVVTVPCLDRPGMEGHPHAERDYLLGPGLRGYAALRINSGGKALRSGVEGSAEGIAHHLVNVAAMPLDRLPEDLVVPVHSRLHEARVLLP